MDDRGGQIVRSTADGKQEAVKGAELPALHKQAVGFAKAVVQHMAAGRPKASLEEAVKRWAICQSCEHLRDTKRGWRCGLCGCFMEIKSSWADQTCKDNRW